MLIDEVDETVKHEIKQEEGGFLGTLLGTLGMFNFSIRKCINWKKCGKRI